MESSASIIQKLTEFDKENRDKLRMLGHQGRMVCDCGAIVDFYWSWYWGYEWIQCQSNCDIAFEEYHFLQ